MSNVLLPPSANCCDAGIDEVGRGALAGPVVAAAVILPQGCRIATLTDSKKLTPKHRQYLALHIKKTALAYAIAMASSKEIDKMNILRATFLAMHRAVFRLTVMPKQLTIDGNSFLRYKKIPHRCIIGGDAKYLHIAAASVLAKVYRDSCMVQLAQNFPKFDWENNKGYPTKKHREAIKKNGICVHHRKSFKLPIINC